MKDRFSLEAPNTQPPWGKRRDAAEIQRRNQLTFFAEEEYQCFSFEKVPLKITKSA
jgi:hypothetical protein